jgi:hypothetical protein
MCSSLRLPSWVKWPKSRQKRTWKLDDFHRHLHDVKGWSEKADLCSMHDLDSQAGHGTGAPKASLRAGEFVRSNAVLIGNGQWALTLMFMKA